MKVAIKSGTEDKTSSRKEDGLASASAEQVEISGRQKYFELRGTWSTWIIGWISVLIVFNIALTLLVGFGCLDFQNYQWFITVVTIETFLQIVALGAIAVKYLFSNT